MTSLVKDLIIYSSSFCTYKKKKILLEWLAHLFAFGCPALEALLACLVFGDSRGLINFDQVTP
jgi:hypothetical protein